MNIIDRFKKSPTGQALIIGFISGSLIATAMVWIYESIRVPPLKEQAEYESRKANNLNEELKRMLGEERRQGEEVTALKREAAEWQLRFEQSFLELTNATEKLKALQTQHLNLVNELGNLKAKEMIKGAANESPSPGLGKALLAAADQEDAALLVVDRDLTEVRLAAYEAFSLTLGLLRKNGQ